MGRARTAIGFVKPAGKTATYFIADIATLPNTFSPKRGARFLRTKFILEQTEYERFIGVNDNVVYSLRPLLPENDADLISRRPFFLFSLCL